MLQEGGRAKQKCIKTLRCAICSMGFQHHDLSTSKFFVSKHIAWVLQQYALQCYPNWLEIRKKSKMLSLFD